MRVRTRRTIPLPGPFYVAPSPKRRPRGRSSGVGPIVVLLLVVVVIVWAIVAAVVHAA